MSLDELDEARFMAFYEASSQARLEYESRPRETERAESWFQHINGLWRCVLELMEQDPRFRR